jgi:hypothetical protein
LSNIFVIGEGAKPLVSLPKGKGVKLSIAGAFSAMSCLFSFRRPGRADLAVRVCVLSEERDQRRRLKAQEA